MKLSIFTLATLMVIGCSSKQIPPSLEQPKESSQTIDRGAVNKEIQSHTDKIKGCYEAALKENPKLAGRVSILFVIAEDGSVSEASYLKEKSTLPDQGMIGCLISQLRGRTFPYPPKGSTAEILFPFTFSNKN